MPCREVTVINKLGLHARASAKLSSTAARFPGTVKIGRSLESLVDAKSIMSVMMLAAGKGSQLLLVTEGEQAEAAENAIVALFEDYFGEGE